MSEILARYSVVLRSDIPAREFEFLSRLCGHITSPSGQDLLHFWCTQIDTSHHVYIQLETFKSGDKVTYPIQVPHQYVLLISGAQTAKAIGFTAPA
jgi:hypothetical protein